MILSWWKAYQRRKRVKHLLREARHARHMRADVVPAADLRRLEQACDALRRAWKDGVGEDALRPLDEAATQAILGLYPPRSRLRFRENIEVLVVAVAVAMAVRTYFVQPFKIPTGSMQPTLYGITVTPSTGRTWLDVPPISWIQWALTGRRYQAVRAQVSGPISDYYEIRPDRTLVIYIGGRPHTLHLDMALRVQPGQYVRRGETLASGLRTLGDQILVDKVRYNFSRPRRGDVFVFDTRTIEHPHIQKDSFYIKRLVGLPGETVRFAPPNLLVDGHIVEAPFPFHRQLHGEGYEGYRFPGNDPNVPAVISPEQPEYRLGPADYFALGDNTASSLDSRYFGSVRQNDTVGPAFMVYWPFSRRWGRIR